MADFEHVEGVCGATSPSGSQAGLMRVTFHGIPETYPLELAVTCRFTIHQSLHPESDDHIGLFKVGWTSVKDFICSSPVPIVESCTAGIAMDTSVIFNDGEIPGDDGEFYQFCYISGTSGHICGASLPFQFGTDDFEIIDDHDESLDDFPTRSANESLIVVDGVVDRVDDDQNRPLEVCTTMMIASSGVELKLSTDSVAADKYCTELESMNARLQLELDSTRARYQLLDESHQTVTTRMQHEIETITAKFSDKERECRSLDDEIRVLKERLAECSPRSTEHEGSMFALQVAQTTLAERNAKLIRDNDELAKQNKELKKLFDESSKREVEHRKPLVDPIMFQTHLESPNTSIGDIENSWSVPDSFNSTKSAVNAEIVTSENACATRQDEACARRHLGDIDQMPRPSLYPCKTWFHNPYADYVPTGYHAGVHAGS